MRKTARTLLPGLLLAGMLALAPMPLLAAVYKCEHGGQVTYSDTPCGKAVQKAMPQVSVVPPFQAPQQPWTVKGMLSSLGLDSKSGLIVMLLFGIPLSFIVVFFMTRKSES